MTETTQDVSDKFSVALADLVLTMLADGYECKAPSPQTADLDWSMIEYKTCSRCKGKLHYEPFTIFNDGDVVSYRAFMVCKTCGKVQEF